MSGTPPKKVKASLKADFTIPPSAMYGKLSQLADTLDTYVGWSYCALLAAWSGRHSTKINCGHKLRPQLYLALVGGPNGGKSVSLDRAIDTINPARIGVFDTIPGSDKAGGVGTWRKGWSLFMSMGMPRQRGGLGRGRISGCAFSSCSTHLLKMS